MEILRREPVSAPRAPVGFRRDLRVPDHPALTRALRDAGTAWCAFVLERFGSKGSGSPVVENVEKLH